MSMTSIGMEKTITDVTITDMVSDDLHIYRNHMMTCRF